jgi:hypothetical protein
MSTTSEVHILDRLLDPVGRCLTPDGARQLIALRADPEIQERLDDLADHSTAGLLTPEERADYETLVRAIDFIAVVQAKAHRLLDERDR